MESGLVSAAAADLSQLRELRGSFFKGSGAAGPIVQVDYLIPPQALPQCFLFFLLSWCSS